MDSLTKKVGIASLIMMGSIFLSRLTGLFREMAIAYVGGAAGTVDAYQVAFVLPEILNHIAASGFLSVTFIPIFSTYLVRRREDDGWEIFAIILNGFGALLAAMILLACVFTGPLISVLAPGLSDPVLKALAVRMTRIILPAQFFFFCGGLFTAVQFAKEKFFVPALAPLLYNAGIVTGGLVLGPRMGMEGFAWGVLAGAFAGNFVLQYWGASRIGMRLRPVFDFRHPDFRKYIRLTVPLMVGLTMTFSTEVLFKFFGSYLPDGGIARLNYGLRIMLMLVAFFGQAAGVASFPYMARLAAEDRIEDLNRLLNGALRYLAVVIPFSVLLIVLRSEVVQLLYQRGRFDAAATAATARILMYLLLGAFAFAAQTIVVRGFYARQNTLLPALYGSLAVLVSVPFYIGGLILWSEAGVAGAISLSVLLQSTLLYVLWNRRSRNRESSSVYRFYGRMILLSLPLFAVLTGFRRVAAFWVDPGTFGGAVMLCLMTGLIFVGLLIGLSRLLGIEEIPEILHRFARRAGFRRA